MPYTPTVYVNNTTPALNATNLNKSETGIQTAQAAVEALAGKYGHILLDDVSGADDDAKLTSALTTAAAQTYPAVIQFSNKQYTFTTRGRAPYEGMRFQAPFGFNNPERNSQTKMSNRIHLNFDSSSDGQGWFHIPSGSVFGVAMDGLSLTGGGTQASFLTSGSDSALWKNLYIRDLTSHGLRTVIGRQSQALAGDAIVFDGEWQINNSYNGAIHMKGSDSTLWTGGNLQIDSGTSFNTTGSANGQFHVWFDFCDKCTVGPMYMTAEGTWNGVKISGPADPRGSTSNNVGAVRGYGWRVEGRNQDAPCNGSLIRVEGGMCKLVEPWLAYAMASPATPGHSPQDAGVVHQTGGITAINGGVYSRATTVAETVPYVYGIAGLMIVKQTMFTSDGGTWTGLPRVETAGTAVLDGDAYVTEI
jgi:hypothetical protein